MELTKEQRLDIYKDILKELKTGNLFLCSAIRLHKSLIIGKSKYYKDISEFVEFLNQEPKIKFFMDVWFNNDDKGRKQRIKIIENCIKILTND